MTLVVDAAPLVALADRRDPMGSRVAAALRDEPGELVVPAPVTTEVDYLLDRRLGRLARLAFLDDLAMRRITVASLEAGDYAVVARPGTSVRRPRRGARRSGLRRDLRLLTRSLQ